MAQGPTAVASPETSWLRGVLPLGPSGFVIRWVVTEASPRIGPPSALGSIVLVALPERVISRTCILSDLSRQSWLARAWVWAEIFPSCLWFTEDPSCLEVLRGHAQCCASS